MHASLEAPPKFTNLPACNDSKANLFTPPDNIRLCIIGVVIINIDMAHGVKRCVINGNMAIDSLSIDDIPSFDVSLPFLTSIPYQSTTLGALQRPNKH